LFIDLDDFKTVNDNYGHQIGDQLLTTAAQRIQGCLRADDLAARVGGDEFAVLLRRVADQAAARSVAQRIADALAEPVTIGDVVVGCQASIGLAVSPAHDPLNRLVRQADIALYSSKAMGKGQWRQYREDMAAPLRQHLEDRRRLELAIQQQKLRLHYQPVVDLRTAEPIGFEALIRMDDDPPMTANEIVAVAEDTGLITTLGIWVLDQALAALPVLNPSSTHSQRYISVNVSARQLRQPDFVDTVRARLNRAHADPALLVLEITESQLVGGDADRAWTFLSDLRHDGVRIALDDYGTGYASLGYLHQPVFDVIKTDSSLLGGPDRQRNLILLDAVCRLCQRLSLDLVVEGVANQRDLQLAAAAGAYHAQGFYFAPALTLADAASWQFTRDQGTAVTGTQQHGSTNIENDANTGEPYGPANDGTQAIHDDGR
jgi:diguanylate cyclase (GGDEF)-like protein